MDGYMYNLDPYHRASAGNDAPRYQPSYALERRSTYGLPSCDTYARVPLDPFAGYGAPAPYQPDVFQPRYVSDPTSPVFRSHPRPTPERKVSPPQNLFKQMQKVRFSEEKERQGRSSQVFQTASVAKETQELHNLFRSGVDSRTGGKPEGQNGGANGAAKKRKADTLMQKLTPTKYFESGKKKKGKKNKKPASEKREAELPLPTEEEIKEAEAALEVQRGFCQSVSQFFGFPDAKVVADVRVGESDGKGDVSKEPEKDAKEPTKFEETKRTPEEEKEIEARSFKFFTRMFAEHQELRNLYVDKCNSGSFQCLVCHSVDATRSKKFWNLVSLVIHTKMREKLRSEHSGFGRAVSAVLGWDHENIPKVPWECRPAKRPANQGKEETKGEPVQEAVDD